MGSSENQCVDLNASMVVFMMKYKKRGYPLYHTLHLKKNRSINVNPSRAETILFRESEINTMAADAPTPLVARLSAGDVLIKQGRLVPLFSTRMVSFTCAIPGWEMIENENIYLFFWHQFRTTNPHS